MKSFNKTYFNEDLQNPQLNGFCILKPEFLDHEDDFVKMLTNNGWQIIQKNKLRLTEQEARELYKMLKDKEFYNDLCKYMCSGDCLCCSCYKDCQNPIDDMNKLKEKIRKAWGKDEMKNAMHSSDSLDSVNRETKLIFEKKCCESELDDAFDDLADLADNVLTLPEEPSYDHPTDGKCCGTCQTKCSNICQDKIRELGLSMNCDEFESLKNMLTDALAEEFNAWYAYIIVMPFLYGAFRPDVVEFFKETAKDELEDHAYWLMDRLNQLGVEFTSLSDPAFWNSTATHKYICPSTDVISAIQNNIKAEQGAIETYTKLEAFTRDKDVVTNCKIKEILKDEQEHLSDLYDLRKDITGC